MNTRKAILPALLPDWHPGVWGVLPYRPCRSAVCREVPGHSHCLPRCTHDPSAAGDHPDHRSRGQGLLGRTDWLGSWFGGIKPALFRAHMVGSPLPEGHSCPGLKQEDGDVSRTQVDVSSPSRGPVEGRAKLITPPPPLPAAQATGFREELSHFQGARTVLLGKYQEQHTFQLAFLV